jgi:hypothetical protein
MTEIKIIHVNHNLGNEWGWFVDFMDEIEVIDELLKPQVNYTRTTSVVAVSTVKKENTLLVVNAHSNIVAKPAINICLNRLLSEIVNLFILGYKLIKKFMTPFI